jgi:hypothetical protein
MVSNFQVSHKHVYVLPHTCYMTCPSSFTVKAAFIVFVVGPEKERWIRETDKCTVYN